MTVTLRSSRLLVSIADKGPSWNGYGIRTLPPGASRVLSYTTIFE